ncbi:MAG TPA: hypothetical protein PKD73_12610 [Burkholderiaceae bacterium]|jgi:hypothetical protein|nr:hypothetical protein [Burkholderiaceae bacterium]
MDFKPLLGDEMNARQILSLSAPGASLLLAGCAGMVAPGPVSNNDDWKNIRRAGTGPVTKKSLEQVNLVELMDPLGTFAHQYDLRHGPGKWQGLDSDNRYDALMAEFGQRYRGAEAGSRRNLIQNRLIAASDRRCGRFFQYLKTDNSDTNFQFAIGSSVLSVLGALVPGATAARNLSGSSALVSGLRAEYNSEYYSNLAVSVITRAIDERRAALRDQIAAAQRQSYAQYDVASAIADGVRYDASCNIAVGLEQANEALLRLKEPGRDAINRALLNGHVTRLLAREDAKSLVDIQKLGVQLSTTAGILIPPAAYPPTEPLANSQAVTVAANTTAKTIEKTFDDGLAMALEALKASKKEASAVASLSADTKSAFTTARDAYLKVFRGNDSKTNACYAEARQLAVTFSATEASLELASGAARNELEDTVADQRAAVRVFQVKLDRYATNLGSLLETQGTALSKSFSAGEKESEQIKAWAAALTPEKVEESVSTTRRCKPKAS